MTDVPDMHAMNQQVNLEVTGASWDAEARILSGAEREDAYRRLIEMAPRVADHQDRAGRTIPMVGPMVRIPRPGPEPR